MLLKVKASKYLKMLIVFLLVFKPQMGFGDNYWLKGVTCGLALTGAVYGNLIYSDHKKEPWGTENKPHIEIFDKYSNLQKGIYSLTMGPTKSLLLKSELRINDKSEHEALIHSLNWLGVYTFLLFGLKGLQRSFFVTPIDQFIKKTDQELDSNPKSVLFLDMIGDKDRLTGYPSAIFDKLYGQHNDARFISFRSAEELKQKLTDLNGKTFDRIEMVAHAKPGKIQAVRTSEGEISIGELEIILSQLSKPITTSQSELRLIACSLLNGISDRLEDPNFEVSELSSFIRAVLPEGGKFIGGSKNIMLFEMVPNAAEYAKNGGHWLDGGMVFISYMLNAEAIRTVFSSIFSLKRDYIDALSDIKLFKIDAEGRVRAVKQVTDD